MVTRWWSTVWVSTREWYHRYGDQGRAAVPNESEYCVVEHGYRVRYPDGYESWSPARTFEEAYRVLPAREIRALQGEAS